MKIQPVTIPVEIRYMPAFLPHKIKAHPYHPN
jgi:hypothetical protein